ncbi:MAG TPA: hypothetical protein VF574_15290 [Allosphingosinicella sp.]|jgi:hypothetical protein
MNTAYVPWSAGGASSTFAIAAAIWLVSTLAIINSFQRSDEAELRGYLVALPAIIAILIIAESVFWFLLDPGNNKLMLLRQSAGNKAALVAAALAIVGALWSSRKQRVQGHFARSARWTAKLVVGSIALELALFGVRTLFHRTPGYYATDCSMFAAAVLSIAMIVAALSRSIPFNRHQAERA